MIGVLKPLGRDHDGPRRGALSKWPLAPFESCLPISIFGVQGEAEDRLQVIWTRCLELGVPHLSPSIEIEPGHQPSPRRKRAARKRRSMRKIRARQDFRKLNRGTLVAAGYRHYESLQLRQARDRKSGALNLAIGRGSGDYVWGWPGAFMGGLERSLAASATETNASPADYICSGSSHTAQRSRCERR